MSAIVTGGAGFIGSHLVDRLAATQRVTVIDDLRWLRGTEPDFMQAWPRRVDVRRESVREAAFGDADADVIYHLAGPVGPVGVLDQAGHIVPDIVADALRMGSFARLRGVPLVYVSTSEVYGVHDGPADEQAPRVIQAGYSARMEYAVAKLAAETMLRGMSGLDVRIVRPFNVAGPRQRPEGGFALPRFLAQAAVGDPLTVYAPGTQRRAFTHVLDIVDGLVAVAERGARDTVYNLGNPANECTILELAEQVVRLTGTTSAIDVVDPVTLWGPGFREAPDKVPDIALARSLGWEPSRDRAQVILDCLG